MRGDRRIPEFRPVPLRLRGMRRGVQYREYARFYGLYTSEAGKRKRFSYSVKVSPRLSNRTKYRLIVVTCNNLLSKRIPQHRLGEVFSSFRELLRRTPWFKVRKLLRYEAGMHYER